MNGIMPAHPSPHVLAGSLAYLALLLTCIVLAGGSAHADLITTRKDAKIVGVHIVSRVNDGSALADDTPKRARSDVGVTLFAVLEADLGGQRIYYSDAPLVRLRGRKHQTHPIKQAPFAALVWYKVEPASESMSNTASGSFRYEPIEYREVLMHSWLLRASVHADVRPTLTPDYGQGLGTMRYKLSALAGDAVVSTPGIDARRGHGSGGLDDRVHRVSLRRDDTYLGLMTEMYGQPYIWASAGRTDRTHQSERLEGADCADLMVYGARRKGYEIPYTWTGGLGPFTRTLAKGTLRDDGVYVDERGKPLPFTQPGDLILFPRHIGALAEDQGVPGVLDTSDIMMHTLFTSPREQPIGESGYADMPVQILRWNKRLDP